MNRTVVLDVVGLTQSLLGEHTPSLRRLSQRACVPVQATWPAVTCSMQSTYLTGALPSSHGIVANGWYFRDLGEVWLWRQSNRLVQGDKIWHLARRKDSSFTCANTCWWYNMHTDVDWSITPRPIYCADGLKLPDCYSDPPELRDRFNREFGQFPLFKYWGPATSIASSDWIAKASMEIERSYQPTLQLVYLPHLDYVLQKAGPDGDVAKDLREIDTLCGQLIDFFTERGCRIVLLSEYGITPVRRAVHPNRLLRQAGLLEVKVDLGREYLDPGRCRAFAVSDHQIAHVYVRHPSDVDRVKAVFEGVDGVERVVAGDAKREIGLDHERSGEVVLLARSDAWFTYYYWDDDARAPDYARTVNIHAKPGYDPCEMLIDPKLRLPKLTVARALARKALGMRYLMEVTPLDASLIKGSHGRPTDRPQDGPLLMTSEPGLLDAPAVGATDVMSLVMNHVFRD